jgi:hypothetical protein
VGEACQKFGSMPQYRRGCYVPMSSRSFFGATVIVPAVLGQASAFAGVGLARVPPVIRRSHLAPVYSRLSVVMHARENRSLAGEGRSSPTMSAGTFAFAVCARTRDAPRAKEATLYPSSYSPRARRG